MTGHTDTRAKALAKAQAHAEKRRLLEQERLQRERRDRQEVGAGIAERVGLGSERGEAFENLRPVRKGRQPPVRRQTGLEWLAKKGRLTEGQLKAGEAYGEAWRMAAAEPRLKSCGWVR